MIKEVLTPEELKAVQRLELDALREFDRICRKHGINYVLYHGTLIGAVRHGGFIPWDDDIDVAVLRSDYNKLIEICQEELNPAFFWQSHKTENNWYRLYSKIRVNGTLFKEIAHEHYNIHQGIYIDVFPMDVLPDSRSKRKWQYRNFRFWNAGLSAKYISMNNRKGKKKFLAVLVRIFFSPFKLSFVYKKAEEAATKYNGLTGNDIANFMGEYGKQEFFSKTWFEVTEDADFEGLSVKIPKEADRVLHQLYGDYMKLPPEEKRVSHHKIVEFNI